MTNNEKLTKKVKEFSTKSSLSEIYQKVGLRFSFLSNKDEQCHPWIKCRDFLHDALRAQASGNPVTGIYGFKFDPKVNPSICLKKMRMVVKNSEPKKDTKEEIKELLRVAENSIKLINHYEDLADIKGKTRCEVVEDKYIVFKGPQFWVKSPALTSMFTFLIRLGTKDLKFKDHESLKKAMKKISSTTVQDNDNDRKYLVDTYDKMDIVVKYADKILFTNNKINDPLIKDKTININAFHNGAGILSLCKGQYVRKEAFEKLKEAIEVDKELSKKAVKSKSKKKLLRIKGFGSPPVYDSYSPESMQYNFIGIDKDGNRVMCHPYHGCREYLTAYIRSGLLDWQLPISFNNISLKQSPALATDKMRYLVTINGVDSGVGRVSKHKKALFFAKKILNFYEDKYGIEPSKVATVKVEYKEKELTSWLFTASNEWMNSPVMYSIYALILRSAHEGDKFAVDAPDDFTDEYVNKFWKDYRKGCKSGNSSLIEKYIEDMDFILANKTKLFTTKPKTALKLDLRTKTNGDYYNKAGFQSLLNGQHFDKPLIKRYKKIKT